MEIKDFVETTLKQLAEALKKSNDDLEGNIKLTNTELRKRSKGNYGLINFDLAVEAKKTNKTGGSGGVNISVLEAKLGKDKETASSSVSRISFTVEANF